MKSTVFKFGSYGFLTSLILFQIAFVIGTSFSYATQEFLGYLTIVLSLLFVFFAIRHFKTNVNDGKLSFANGLLIGISITAFVALGSAIADYIFVTMLYPDFVTDYADYQLQEMQARLSAAEFEVARAEMETRIQRIGSPLMMAAIMFVTVLLLGFIITLLSTFLLQTKKTRAHNTTSKSL
jgi:hypothetical protein